MKNCCLILSLALFVFSFLNGFGQQKKNSGKNNSSSIQEKHISIDSFPTNMMVNHLKAGEE